MRSLVACVMALSGCSMEAAGDKAAIGGTGNDAAFVAQSVPSAMLAGRPYLVAIRMRNTGTTTWTAAGNYRLGSQNPQDNNTWGTGRVEQLPAAVAPGVATTFVWEAVAPSTPGTYAFQWRMVQDGVEWFGEFTPSVDVVVSPAPPQYLAPDGVVFPWHTQFVTLHFSEVDGAVSYPVQVIDVSDGTVRDFPALTRTDVRVRVAAGHDYQWSVAARDGAGTLSGPATASFSVRAHIPDVTPPTLSIVAPAPGAPVSGRVLVSVLAGDDVDLKRVELRASAHGRRLLLREPPYLFLWDSRDVGDGGHVLTVEAEDAAHNTATATLAVTVDNRELGPCIPPGDGSVGDEVALTAALSAPGATAILCPGAVYHLQDAVEFRFADQDIHTQGFPTGDLRAKLLVDGGPFGWAVAAFDHSGVKIRNIEIDGQRGGGPSMVGEALIVVGADSRDILIDRVKAHDTKTWSTIHLFEGDVSNPAEGCGRALVVDNELGPAGFPGGEWADGISLACRDSRVARNVIVDATDGAIVVFGAPGSRVEHNLIWSRTRDLLGGINMVDFGPFDGDYRGTVVAGNVIAATGAPIKVAVAMGNPVWGCVFDDAHRNVGAAVLGNLLLGGRMHYGFVANGVADWTVLGNVSLAVHSGVPESVCGFPTPSPPAPFLKSARAGWTLQDEFVDGQVDALLGVHD